MKHIVLTIIVLLSWQLVFADVVTQEQARRRAADFFAAAEVQTKASAVRPEDFKLLCTFPQVATKASEAPALFVFEREEGGYAIVSGDDVARPVLGFSTASRFPLDDMPDSMRATLQWYADVIAYARSQHWPSASMPTDAGLDPANTVQLRTAQWNQGKPFNNLVAEINGQKPPIGCVATSIAIVMQYHQWPMRGTGTLPSYDYSKNGQEFHVDGFALGHEYFWDQMPPQSGNFSEEEAAQIARLLYDVAVMSEMSFYPGGSGASSWSGLKLAQYFGYDRRIRVYEREGGYPDSQWEQFIKDDIDANRPVLYSGFTGSSGHAFVLDGYNGRYFSINYGWGGGSIWRPGHDHSGRFADFFTLTPIEGHEEDLLHYNLGQDMICHIMPDQGGEPEPVLRVSTSPRLSYWFKIGEAFNRYCYVCNSTLGDFTLTFRYDLFDASGNSKGALSEEWTSDIVNGWNWLEPRRCIVTQSPAEGDFIALALKDPSTGKWSPVQHDRNNRIVFTRRPLSELVELGYVDNPAYPDAEHPERKRFLSLQLFTDLIWEIDGLDVWRTVWNYFPNAELSWEELSLKSWLLDASEGQNFQKIEMWLPTGSYKFIFRNPATDEEMVIHLEL